MAIIKIQPGPAEDYDSYIDEANPATNYKTSVLLYIEGISPDRRWALIQFDLSTLPLNVTVTKAEIGVWVFGQTGDVNIDLHEISQVWYLDTVTWNLRPIPGFPAHPGVAASGAWMIFDVLDIVQDWVENPTYNLGVQLIGSLCNAHNVNIAAANYLADPTKRPYLEITYTGGAGLPAGLTGEGHITLLPDMQASITGSWTWAAAAGVRFVEGFYNNSNAIGNSITWNVYLDQATYILKFAAQTNVDRAIIKFTVAGVDVVASLDLNAAPNPRYVYTSAPFNVAAAGLTQVTITVIGTTAVPPTYYCLFDYLALYRTT